MTPQKVTDKIRAMLRKAEEGSNPSEAERDVAMQMAQRLMLKHGLSMQDVGEIDSDEDRKFEQESYLSTEGDESWKGSLLSRIGKIYFCKVYFISVAHNKRRWVIVGRKDHAEMAKMLYEFIWPQIQNEFDTKVVLMKQSPRYARQYALSVLSEETGESTEDATDEYLAFVAMTRFERIRVESGGDVALRDIMDHTGISKSYAAEVRPFIRKQKIAPAITHNLGVWRRSFFSAAVGKVNSRLKEMHKEEVKDLGTPGVDLVLNEQGALKKAMKDMGLNLHTQRSQRQNDANGHSAGREAGARADLSGSRKVAGARKQLGS